MSLNKLDKVIKVLRLTYCQPNDRYLRWYSKHHMYMKRFFLLVLVLILAGPIITYAQEPTFEKGNLLIRTMPGTGVSNLLERLDHEQPHWGVHLIRQISPSLNIWQIGIDPQLDHEQVLEELQGHPWIHTAQLNLIIQMRNTPNDSLFSSQWQYVNTGQSGGTAGADLDADSAWTIATGGVTANGDTIVVCVIDDGIDTNHRDFGDNLWINRAEIPGNNIDDDNNGYIDDYKGWNVYSNPEDDNIALSGWHGTPVAGIVGAQGDNNRGVSGVNWNVKLMIVVGGGNISTLARVLSSYAYPLEQRRRYNATNGLEGAFVVATNSSWGQDFGQPSQAPLWCAMYDSLGAAGILNCGATINGNYDVDSVGDLPTACPSDYMIAVTNMDHHDMKVSNAGYGATTIDLGAFGQGTYTTADNNNYYGFGGTSGATPHVTGAIALAYSMLCTEMLTLGEQYPDSLARILRNILLDNVQPNASLSGITSSGGRLNLYHFLLGVQNYCGLSAEEIEKDDEFFTLFPNPAGPIVRIVGKRGIVGVWLIDPLGRKMDVTLHANSVDLNGLAAGTYTMVIIDDQERQHYLRFIKD
jgi:hypothetical protein